jgi:hypothetical protein
MSTAGTPPVDDLRSGATLVQRPLQWRGPRLATRRGAVGEGKKQGGHTRQRCVLSWWCQLAAGKKCSSARQPPDQSRCPAAVMAPGCQRYCWLLRQGRLLLALFMKQRLNLVGRRNRGSHTRQTASSDGRCQPAGRGAHQRDGLINQRRPLINKTAPISYNVQRRYGNGKCSASSTGRLISYDVQRRGTPTVNDREAAHENAQRHR